MKDHHAEQLSYLADLQKDKRCAKRRQAALVYVHIAMLCVACGGGGDDNIIAAVAPEPVATPAPAPVSTPAPSPVLTPAPAPVLTPVPAPVPVVAPAPVTAPVPAPAPLPAPAPINKTWKIPSLIESSEAGNAVNPQIAVDASGNAIAVWSQSDGTRENIYANRFTPATGWDAVQLIETDDAGRASLPQIAIDGSGNAIAVWTQSDGTQNNIWSNRYTPTAGWGAAQLLETDPGDARGPKLVIDAIGSATVIWSQYIRISPTSAQSNIWARRFTLAGGWANATLLETDNSLDTNLPELAADGSGNVMAVWRQFDGTRRNIASKRFAPEAGWSSRDLIATNNVGTADHPKVAFDASGHAIAVWDQSNGNVQRKIWANRYAPGGGWGAAAMIQTNRDAGDAWFPRIAVDRAGNAIALWHQSAGGPHNIWSKHFTPATGWGNEQLIENNTSGGLFPEIKFDNDGNAIAVWSQSDGVRDDIWANRFTPAGSWSGAMLIESNDAGDAFAPQIAIDASGNAVVVWSQTNKFRDDTGRFSIWSARFD